MEPELEALKKIQLIYVEVLLEKCYQELQCVMVEEYKNVGKKKSGSVERLTKMVRLYHILFRLVYKSFRLVK